MSAGMGAHLMRQPGIGVHLEEVALVVEHLRALRRVAVVLHLAPPARGSASWGPHELTAGCCTQHHALSWACVKDTSTSFRRLPHLDLYSGPSPPALMHR